MVADPKDKNGMHEMPMIGRILGRRFLHQNGSWVCCIRGGIIVNPKVLLGPVMNDISWLLRPHLYDKHPTSAE